LIWVGRGRDRVGMGDSEELTHMLAAVAEGIAVGPGCSSLGWPFCRNVLSRCMQLGLDTRSSQ
jgi:hypothetical protein